MERYYHHYKGIIIQNNDPNNIGRVKVFVPEVNMTLYKDWNSTKDTDKKFTHLGENLDSSLSPEILERLKKSLPWAQVKQPIFGMSAPVTYDAEQNVSLVANDSDSSNQQKIINKKNAKEGEKQKEQEGNKTAEAIEQIANNDDPYNNPNKNINVLNSIVPSWKNTGGDADNCTVKSVFCAQEDQQVPSESSIEENTSETTPVTPFESLIPNDNILGVVISFLPDAQYYKNINPNRGFTANEPKPTIDPVPQLTTVVNKKKVTVNAKSSAPIKYQLFTFAPNDSSNSESSNANDNFDQKCVFFKKQLKTPEGQTFSFDDLPVQFVPNDTYHKNLASSTNSKFARSFVEKPANIKITNGALKTKNTSIDISRITEVKLIYSGSFKPVDLKSNRLGSLAPLFKPYTESNSGLNQEPIIPPVVIPVIPTNSFGQFGQYNRGGGGGELFSVVQSDLLPIQNVVNSQIGASNPQSLMGTNYTKPIDKSVDPDQTVNSNIQSKPNSKPAIRSSTQNNKTKGMISIPAVGAHVSVYFENGNPQFPIIDGAFQAQEGYSGIHDISA